MYTANIYYIQVNGTFNGLLSLNEEPDATRKSFTPHHLLHVDDIPTELLE